MENILFYSMIKDSKYTDTISQISTIFNLIMFIFVPF